MSYQQVTIVGNVGQDPELRYTGTGTPVTGFSVAVSRSWTDAEGQKQEKTIWFKVSAWRKLAETICQYVVKGRQILVVGEFDAEPKVFKDRSGEYRAAYEITARDVRFLGNKNDSEGSGNGIAPRVAAEPSIDEQYPF